ncbi:MAG: YIP1 family protein [Lachnospiraceae bacterium]|nr:YIP1 family protein [Lachnospiraceae bacterium]
MSLNLKTKINKQAVTRYFESLRYALYVLTHPFDGFWDLVHEKRGSMAAAHTLLILTFVTNLWSMRFTNFMFNDVRWERVNIWQQVLGLLAPLLIYCVANWCLTTLFDGKGRLKDIYMGMCYSLTPYILIMNPITIISNFVTDEEGAFLAYFNVLAIAWAAIWILISVMQIHDYSLMKAILAIAFSAVGMMIIVFLIMLFFSLVSDAVAFFISIGKEILFRIY